MLPLLSRQAFQVSMLHRHGISKIRSSQQHPTKNVVRRLVSDITNIPRPLHLLLNRPLLELIPKEKVAGLPVFTQALRLVPFTMPEHWSGPRLCEDLPGLLHHLASAVILSAFVIHNLDPAYASLLPWRGSKQNLHLALQAATGLRKS